MIATKDDFELLPTPTDSISDLAWSPVADYIAVASWDAQTRIYEVVHSTRQSLPKASIQHEGPVLCCVWSPDGMRVASAGADKTIRILDLQSMQTSVIRDAHGAPIRCLRWVQQAAGIPAVLISGSWDRTVRYWDMRGMVAGGGVPAAPMGVLQLPERCYSMDVQGALLCIGTAERHILLVDLSPGANPTAPTRSLPSPLKMQTRTVAVYPDASGFAIGSVEGRVGLQWVDPRNAASNFAYKCHRDNDRAFSVNSIAFHPAYGTFATAGSDGGLIVWDKDSKQRLEAFPPTANNTPIPVISFSRDGNLLAYALSYDWSKGHEHYQPNSKNTVMIHKCQDSEVKPRTGGPNAFRRR